MNTLLSFSKLDMMLRQRPLADIPNQEGFKLVAILSNGLGLPVEVRKGRDGLHALYDSTHRRQPISQFTGWIPDDHDPTQS